MGTTKIATCCYCGTRAALVLRGEVRHELSCASCGAPLHNMKHLKAAATSPGRKDTKGPRKTARPASPAERKVRQKPRKKKSKGLAHRFFDEAFDLLDDIFD
ncbi:hypothetical protein [Antarctobacter heliothermus]|uniref:Uncharacterized protein n=1 Tax=Antarctobacter heliothermus TaxID=74033 RepID=A0A239CMD2_9RHOB|nr:hypothetical protein [Antarctobacter heliothermus]SNS20654.1 hypothetical protein SAMN04488078_100746 [Antarctobacter heliothermus]